MPIKAVRKGRKHAWQSWETAKVEIAGLLEQKHGGVVEAAGFNKRSFIPDLDS